MSMRDEVIILHNTSLKKRLELKYFFDVLDESYYKGSLVFKYKAVTSALMYNRTGKRWLIVGALTLRTKQITLDNFIAKYTIPWHKEL